MTRAEFSLWRCVTYWLVIAPFSVGVASDIVDKTSDRVTAYEGREAKDGDDRTEKKCSERWLPRSLTVDA